MLSGRDGLEGRGRTGLLMNAGGGTAAAVGRAADGDQRKSGAGGCARLATGDRSVRSVRSPATVLRTLGACRPANQRFFFGPFRALTSPKSGMRVRSSHYFAPVCVSGDGGNRTRVRNRVKMASTSVAGALLSSPARHAGRVAGDQSPWIPRLAEDSSHRVSLLSEPGPPRRRRAGSETHCLAID